MHVAISKYELEQKIKDCIWLYRKDKQIGK